MLSNALRRPLLALSLALPMLVGGAALAVQPDEMLADPALEARARAVSAELRCLVCQNQSIDDSDAPLAKDLRILVRERIMAGDDDRAVKNWLVSRYGEFVLLRPSFSAHNLILWLSPFAILAIGGVVAMRTIRRRGTRAAAAEAPLSAEESERLARILEQDGRDRP
jgi:cytochrome c-type biogenesis protein CcmH